VRYLIRLKYNGEHFHGWQIQPNAITVQEVLEQKLSMVLTKEVKVVGCGRTDTGVHASDYYAHFDLLDCKYSSKKLLFKLNCVLPDAIVISELRSVQQNFHARFTATSREYKYYITKQKNPFNKNTWWIKYELDTNKMQQAGKSLLGKKDFSSFAKLNTDVANHICEVTHFDIKEEGSNVIITISANRFLRNMVRAIVGTLASVGLGKISVKEFIDVIDKKDRSAAGLSAPAQGLFLCAVKYPEAEITVINKVEEEESGNE